jgi:carbonic anhydrase
MKKKKFCTAINCMDGRVQLPVNKFLHEYFNAEYVDTITEPGPNLILSKKTNKKLIDSIIKRTEISVYKHKSVGIAIVGHYDCAGNPSKKKEQIVQVKKSIKFLQKQFDEIEIIGLWVNKKWEVSKI